eukprot:g64917.t1
MSGPWQLQAFIIVVFLQALVYAFGLTGIFFYCRFRKEQTLVHRWPKFIVFCTLFAVLIPSTLGSTSTLFPDLPCLVIHTQTCLLVFPLGMFFLYRGLRLAFLSRLAADIAALQNAKALRLSLPTPTLATKTLGNSHFGHINGKSSRAGPASLTNSWWLRHRHWISMRTFRTRALPACAFLMLLLLAPPLRLFPGLLQGAPCGTMPGYASFMSYTMLCAFSPLLPLLCCCGSKTEQDSLGVVKELWGVMSVEMVGVATRLGLQLAGYFAASDIVYQLTALGYIGFGLYYPLHLVHRFRSSYTDSALTLAEVLEDPRWREAFRDHLKTEFSQENLLFWEAVEEWHKGGDFSLVNARRIYERFIAHGAPLQINLPAPVLKQLKRAVDVECQSPTRDVRGPSASSHASSAHISHADSFSRRSDNDGWARRESRESKGEAANNGGNAQASKRKKNGSKQRNMKRSVSALDLSIYVPEAIFDAARDDIYELMVKDSFRRWQAVSKGFQQARQKLSEPLARLTPDMCDDEVCEEELRSVIPVINKRLSSSPDSKEEPAPTIFRRLSTNHPSIARMFAISHPAASTLPGRQSTSTQRPFGLSSPNSPRSLSAVGTQQPNSPSAQPTSPSLYSPSLQPNSPSLYSPSPLSSSPPSTQAMIPPATSGEKGSGADPAEKIGNIAAIARRQDEAANEVDLEARTSLAPISETAQSKPTAQTTHPAQSISVDVHSTNTSSRRPPPPTSPPLLQIRKHFSSPELSPSASPQKIADMTPPTSPGKNPEKMASAGRKLDNKSRKQPRKRSETTGSYELSGTEPDRGSRNTSPAGITAKTKNGFSSLTPSSLSPAFFPATSHPLSHGASHVAGNVTSHGQFVPSHRADHGQFVAGDGADHGAMGKEDMAVRTTREPFVPPLDRMVPVMSVDGRRRRPSTDNERKLSNSAGPVMRMRRTNSLQVLRRLSPRSDTTQHSYFARFDDRHDDPHEPTEAKSTLSSSMSSIGKALRKSLTFGSSLPTSPHTVPLASGEVDYDLALLAAASSNNSVEQVQNIDTRPRNVSSVRTANPFSRTSPAGASTVLTDPTSRPPQTGKTTSTSPRHTLTIATHTGKTSPRRTLIIATTPTQQSQYMPPPDLPLSLPCLAEKALSIPDPPSATPSPDSTPASPVRGVAVVGVGAFATTDQKNSNLGADGTVMGSMGSSDMPQSPEAPDHHRNLSSPYLLPDRTSATVLSDSKHLATNSTQHTKTVPPSPAFSASGATTEVAAGRLWLIREVSQVENGPWLTEMADKPAAPAESHGPESCPDTHRPRPYSLAGRLSIPLQASTSTVMSRSQTT